MYRIGVDLGGTNIAVGIIDENNNLLFQDSTPTLPERPYDVVMKDMGDVIEKLLKENNIDISQVKSIGVGSPGTCNSFTGVVERAYNLNWFHVPVTDILTERFGIPAHLSNDANVAALAEVVCGAAVGHENAVLITLGTGVGGGIIINGKIYAGMRSAGAELGHIAITMEGERCTCGRVGCWEAYASATAFIRQAKEAAKKHPESKLASIEIKGAKEVFEVDAQGDEIARQVVDQYATYIAAGLTDIVNALAPEIILLGGGVAKSADRLLPTIQDFVENNCFGQKDGAIPVITVAKLGNEAGIIGAAAL